MLQLPAHLINRKERRARDARRGRMGEARYNAVAKELARVIRLAFQAGATGSLWGLEGPLRAGIRSDLCLQGWRWAEADKMAREVLEDAFRIAGPMIRPTWNEGQPEWTIEAGTLIERTHCARCFKPLPDGNHKFCSDLCRASFHAQIARRKSWTEQNALDLAVRTI